MELSVLTQQDISQPLNHPAIVVAKRKISIHHRRDGFHLVLPSTQSHTQGFAEISGWTLGPKPSFLSGFTEENGRLFPQREATYACTAHITFANAAGPYFRVFLNKNSKGGERGRG